MKRKKRIRVLTFLLAWIMVLLAPADVLNAGLETLDTYTAHTDDTYQPMAEGYYGYLPVRYESGDSIVQKDLPVLVKDGHTLADICDLCLRLGISYTESGQGVRVDAYHRTVIFLRNSPAVYWEMHNTCLEYTLPVSTVWQDERLWVPLELFFRLTGGEFYAPKDSNGSLSCIAMGGPQKNILDVLYDLYLDPGYFDYVQAFGKADLTENRPEATDKLKWFDVYDGMLNGELDKWAVFLSSQSTIADLVTDDAYGAEVMTKIVQSDEAEIIETAGNRTSLGLDAYGMIMSSAESGFSMLGTAFENNDYRWEELFKMLEEGYQEGAAVVKPSVFIKNINADMTTSRNMSAISKVAKGAEIGGTVTGYLVEAGICLAEYDARDTMAVKGARAFLDDLSENSTLFRARLNSMPQYLLPALDKKLELFESGKAAYVFTEVLLSVAGSFVKDRVLDVLGGGFIVDLYTFATRLNPKYTDTLDSSEAFQQSLTAMLYNRDAYECLNGDLVRIFGTSSDRFPDMSSLNRRELKLSLEQTKCLAYNFVKSRYVTRCLGMKAMQKMKETDGYRQQETWMKIDLEQMALLASYDAEAFYSPYDLGYLLAGYSDAYLQIPVIPYYIHVTGSYVDQKTKQPVSGVNTEITSARGMQPVSFLSGADGTFDFYLPLSMQENQEDVLAETLTFTFSHPDYPDLQPKSFSVTLEQLDNSVQTFPLREYQVNTGAINLGTFNYYEFIRDNLLPQMGYASLETTAAFVDGYHAYNAQEASTMLCWDRRSGLLGADIADLNRDGTEDLLVYYLAPDTDESVWGNGIYCTAAYVDLYTVSRTGDVIRIGTQLLDRYNNVEFNCTTAGLTEIGGKTYLYVESSMVTYFANNSDNEYVLYEYGDDGRFLPHWRIYKSDGGSSEIAYSLETRISGENYDRSVLYGDSGYRYYYPDMPIYTSVDTSQYDALRMGLQLIGLPEANSSMGDSYNISPSYAGNPQLKMSFQYQCRGEGNSDGKNMTVTLSDLTELKRHIDELP